MPASECTHNVDLTVVITTLGGPDLDETVKCVLNSSVSVSKVLVCIPKQCSSIAPVYDDERVFVHLTEEKGQVKQRISGFRQVTTAAVLQLDDDVCFASDAIEKTYNTLVSYGPKHAIGAIIDKDDRFISDRFIRSRFAHGVKELFVTLIAGAPVDPARRIGSYSKYGWCQLVPASIKTDQPIPVHFLPGGYCMSWSSETILQNYYPLEGKAFKEDLLNSIERSQNQIKHIILPYNRVTTAEHAESFPTFKQLRNEFAACRYVAYRLGCHPLSVRMYLYIITEIVYGIYRKKLLRDRLKMKAGRT